MPSPKFCVFIEQLKIDKVQKPINSKKYVNLLQNSPISISSIQIHLSLAFRVCVLRGFANSMVRP